MALAYSDITVELKEISLKNRPPELFAFSSKGTVPVLCINNSTVIDESLQIMKWALDQHDPKSWIDNKKKIQFEMIEIYDNEFKCWLDRYKYYDRYPDNNQSYYRNKCAEYLSELNLLLNENRYLVSNDLKLLDVAILPFIRQCANVDMQWFNKNFVNVTIWLNNLLESKLFLSIMDKYSEYKYAQDPLIINFTK